MKELMYILLNYQKNNDTYYTQLHLPKTVLTAGEYIDIMNRLQKRRNL